MLCTTVYTQNQQLADSLEMVYNQGGFEEKDRLEILKNLAFNQQNPEVSLRYSEELLKRAQKIDSTDYILAGWLQQGNALVLKGDLSNALESYFNGARLAIATERQRSLGLLYNSIAGVYSVLGNSKNTIRYYRDAIDILRKEEDTVNYASALENLGDEYLNLSKPDSALMLFNESGGLFKALDYKAGIAYNLGNTGLAYAQKGDAVRAERDMAEAISMLSEMGNYYAISVYQTHMSDIYAQRREWAESLGYALKSLELARQHNLKEQISAANLKLSELYEEQGDYVKSLGYYKDHIIYRDSVTNIKAVQEMADVRADFQVAQKQGEVDLLEKEAEVTELRNKRQRIVIYGTGITLILVILLALGAISRNKFISKTNRIIAEEKQRSENLLLNILPEETAIELKENGKVQAKRFESVTVLFTDFESFTRSSENLSPEELVEGVDFYYSRFDEIMEKYGLEMIKTIGDSYMCAGGLPFPTEDHACKMVFAAMEILEFVEESKVRRAASDARFKIRIGINTGPVVAGVVGSKKFAYDIWGDTVNVASRMESLSAPDKINISANTYDLVKDIFNCEYRGEIPVKNKGVMKMYYVRGKKATMK
jgi:class 3 adenylate cyclase